MRPGSERKSPHWQKPVRAFWYARHGRYLGGERPLRTLVRRTASGRQLRKCERAWEGSRKQSLDLMNKNCVERHGAPGKLAKDSEALRGPKRLDVNAARLRRKKSHLIRGDLTNLRVSQESAEAIVVDGVTPIRGGQRKLSTGRRAERLRS